MKTHPVLSHLFEKNRAKLAKLLPSKAVAIISAADLMPKNSDQKFTFRQYSNFYYLTGIEQTNCILILLSDWIEHENKEILFIEQTSQHDSLWTGTKLSKEQAKALSGIDQIYWIDELDLVLQRILPNIQTVYLTPEQPAIDYATLQTANYRLLNKIKGLYPLHHYEDGNVLLAKLRQIKEPEEIEQIRQAISISATAFFETLKVIKPGLYEYEIEAEISYHFTRKGCRFHAFEPIIASGKNACILHYTHNNHVCNDGDLLLIDFGAEYNNYAADITRTVPINGQYNKRQLQVYQSVLRLLKEAMRITKKGKTIEKIQEELIPFIEEELIQLGLISREEVKNETIEKRAYKKYYLHGISHFLGLDVHDVGKRTDILQPGMVITCEPGIYIREEGIGIRIENDLLITENEPINLTKDIPIEPKEIEALMRKSIS